MPFLPLIIVVAGVFALNLPFGYWRAGTRKFSLAWIAAVHLPIPLVVALRLASGLGWAPYSFPFVIGAYFCGQYLGGRIRQGRGKPGGE